MLYFETDPESYITEYTLVYEDFPVRVDCMNNYFTEMCICSEANLYW